MKRRTSIGSYTSCSDALLLGESRLANNNSVVTENDMCNPTEPTTTNSSTIPSSQNTEMEQHEENMVVERQEQKALLRSSSLSVSTAKEQNRNLQLQEAGQEQQEDEQKRSNSIFWGLLFCFSGIVVSFCVHNFLLEYATRKEGDGLDELSFLFISSLIATVVAVIGRHVRDEKKVKLELSQVAILGVCNMGSAFFSVRSLRYVIFPVKVLAKSCKPVPVMVIGTCMGKRYPLRKCLNVLLIVFGVALFMGGGKSSTKKHDDDNSLALQLQLMGIAMILISLCFDGFLGAYEDKLVKSHTLEPFDLMYNIQLANTIMAAVGLIVLNKFETFMKMVNDLGWILMAIGVCGAVGSAFIFTTITRFGALTCSIMGLARKVVTISASIYIYGHSMQRVQFLGMAICVCAMAGEPLHALLSQNQQARAMLEQGKQTVLSLFRPIGSDIDDASQKSPGKLPVARRSRSLAAGIFVFACIFAIAGVFALCMNGTVFSTNNNGVYTTNTIAGKDISSDVDNKLKGGEMKMKSKSMLRKETTTTKGGGDVSNTGK